MLNLESQTSIYLYTSPADMRKGFDGLMGLIAQAAMGDVYHGLFVFCNRRADRMKILYFDRDGLAIWYKRLEQGRFQWPTPTSGRTSMTIDASELRLMLDGIDFRSVKRRRRWSQPDSVPSFFQNSQKGVDNCPKLDKPVDGATVSVNRYGTAQTHHPRRRSTADQPAGGHDQQPATAD